MFAKADLDRAEQFERKGNHEAARKTRQEAEARRERRSRILEDGAAQ